MSRSQATTADPRPGFRVALSFAGEQGDLVEAVTERLAETLGRNQVFYYRDHPAEMGNFDQDLHLQPLYRDRSRLVVVFLSGAYGRSEWCRAEWLAIRELRNRGRSKQILLLRVDEGPVRGLSDTDVPLDIRGADPGRIADLIHERLLRLPTAQEEAPDSGEDAAGPPPGTGVNSVVRLAQAEEEVGAGRVALRYGRRAFLAGAGLALAATLLLLELPELEISLFGRMLAGTSLPAGLSIACCAFGLTALLLQEKVRSALYRLEFEHDLLFEDVSARIGMPDVFRDHSFLYKSLCLLTALLQVIIVSYSAVIERLASADPLAEPFPYGVLLWSALAASPYVILFLRPVTPEAWVLRRIRKGSSAVVRAVAVFFAGEETQTFFRELFWLDDLMKVVLESWARWMDRNLRQRGNVKHFLTFGLPLIVFYVRYARTLEREKGPAAESMSIARTLSRSVQLCRPPADLLDALDAGFRRLFPRREREPHHVLPFDQDPDDFLRTLGRARVAYNEQWSHLPEASSVYDWYRLFKGYFVKEASGAKEQARPGRVERHS